MTTICPSCGASTTDRLRPVLRCGRLDDHPVHTVHGPGVVTTTPQVHIHRPTHTCLGRVRVEGGAR